MLRTIFISAIYLTFLCVGIGVPFVLTLGYVWVDAFKPQYVAYYVLNQIPVAMIMGAAAIGSYLLMDRRHPPRVNTIWMLQIAITFWCAISMIWAVSPAFAWEKWDWAIKTLLFSCFLPLVIRSKVQIEAFLLTYLLSLAANIIPFGAKTIMGGGGYGKNFGLVSGNAGLAEGGLLSTACIMVIPLALHFARHNDLLPKWRFAPLPFWGIAALALATAIGTHQRSALIGLVAMGVFLALGSRHKLLYLMMGGIVAGILSVATTDQWADRISSISEYKSESSALTRILVWKWTLEFVTSHPLGGGFNSYVINQIVFPGDANNPGGSIQNGRAFHSIYFEMLGEQGWPGLFMFFGMTGITMWTLFRISRRTARIPELEWCSSLAVALQAGLIAFLTAGAFVGIVFQPMFWYFVAATVSLRAYLQRVEAPDSLPTTGWRVSAHRNLSVATGPAKPGGWRPAVLPATARRARSAR